MTDIKEKLKRLRQEREARSRSQQIQDAWNRLEKKDELSTRDKLEQLISLKRERVPRSQTPPLEKTEREPLQFTENPYSLDARYGRITVSAGLDISGEVLAYLSKDPAFEKIDLSTALFIDLETTGLSGGTGVIPFNIGMGYYRDDKFWVGQYFLGEPASEEKMIKDLSRFLKEMNFQSVVTYNGKAFDIPLLETRFILHREPLLLSGLPHLDFLFPARNLWKHKHESCRLFHLAREVLETGRDEDIPSSEIPWRYFQYLQTGNFELIEPILYHNAEDILSLLGVVVMGASFFSENSETNQADAMDLFGAGKVMEKVGDVKKAAIFFERALNGDLSEEAGLSTRRRLSIQHKRNRQWEKAVPLWREMASSEILSADVIFSLRELAMFFEHQEKDYIEAQKMAEEGFVLSRGFSAYFENDFIKRRERLKQKIKNQPPQPDQEK